MKRPLYIRHHPSPAVTAQRRREVRLTIGALVTLALMASIGGWFAMHGLR